MESTGRSAARSGAQLLVDALRIHGADVVFGVPGESYLAVLDALYDARDVIRFIICRHEGGAANMADAYGKLTGRPGICFVTRGPGATNASIGIHTAFQDSTPLILLIGQVNRAHAEREAFQEIDYRRMYGPLAKWVAQIEEARRIPEMVSRAFHVAVSGRPGPVVLALPEDMQREMANVPDADRYQRVAAHPGADELLRLRGLLEQAERPLVIVGGSGWTAQACSHLREFLTANNLPAGAAFRCQDILDNRDPHYAGDIAVGLNPALAQRIVQSDLLMAIGPRLGEWTTCGYTLIDLPRPRQKFVHVHAGAEELGRVYQGDLLINAGMPEFAAAAAALEPVNVRWSEWTQRARADYEDWQKPVVVPGNVNLSEIMLYLRGRLPADAIITNGAGNFSLWIHRFYRYTGWRTQLAPTSGAMGYGVPAAVAAKLVHPERPVIAFAGDGCFMMNGQELATAMQYDARAIFIVVNNGMLGTIRMHQERQYPGRVFGTELRNPDFVALARAYGLHAERIEATAEFAPAFERACQADRPALIEIKVDPEAITPRATLSAIRAEALKSKQEQQG